MLKKPLSGLCAFLARQGLFDEKEATLLQQEAEKAGLPVITYLIDQGSIDEERLAKLLSESFGLPLFDLSSLKEWPLKFIKDSQVKAWHVLPLYQSKQQLSVAVSDPLNQEALQALKLQTQMPVEAVLVKDGQLHQFIKELLRNQHSKTGTGLQTFQDLIEFKASHAPIGETHDTPVVEFINNIIFEAVARNASDIHFEPYEEVYRIRMRLDGVLHTVSQPPLELLSRLTTRLKVMAQMDIAERRIPQDGRFKLTIDKRAVDFRVSACPTLFGEKMVVRILDSKATLLRLDALGFSAEQRALLMHAISQPQGMIMVTGPTGSGKTVTLYCALNVLNKEDSNICTVEDPVEINLPGINQVHVNPKAGLTFASTLRAFLRQDPDIIMVGEIRDLETAEIALKASQTGHLVLSTLHTNSAAETIVRLLSMGIPSYNLASSLILIVAQRLARRLCLHCRAMQTLPKEALLQQGFLESELIGLTIYHAVGCEHCNQGYKGRVGLFEVLALSPFMQALIMKNGSALDLSLHAQSEGMVSLRRDGLNKVKAGITSLDELNRVSKS